MTNVKKTAVSLPQEVYDRLEEDRQAGRIPSISGHITALLQREQNAADAAATLRRLFSGERPENEHLAWARKALGLAGNAPAAS